MDFSSHLISHSHDSPSMQNCSEKSILAKQIKDNINKSGPRTVPWGTPESTVR